MASAFIAEGEILVTDQLTHGSDRLAQLDHAAAQAANVGRWDEAERAWAEMRSIAPNNRNALWGLGFAALHAGDAERARSLLLTARMVAPQDKIVLMTLARACRDCKDTAGEAAAIAATLTVDPKFLPALLAQGALFERNGHPDAISAYTSALEAAPAREQDWPEELRPSLRRAKAAVERHKLSLFSALADKVSSLADGMSASERGRWREAASILAKMTAPYDPECHKLFVPRLAAQPFFERSQFAWVEALEAKTDVIRSELMRALEAKGEAFLPYVTLDRGGAAEEWKELNHSTRWSVFYLWLNGKADDDNIALCPETMKALASVDQAHITGACPNAMFSALAPRTHIPPHTGESNARLVVHLPLIVPENCGTLRVGFEEREWKVGEALIFDDSIEHEAWNKSDELRVVLLFDIWHPALSLKDREMVNALVAVESEFRTRNNLVTQTPPARPGPRPTD